MLDPWTALSLATSIAQFIDFGTKLVSDVKNIKAEGSSLHSRTLETVTEDLIRLGQNIKNQHSSQRNSAALTSADHELNDLAIKCTAEAEVLVQTLSILKSKSKEHSELKRKSKEHSTWKSVGVALRTVWNADEIDGLQKRLSMYREQLALRLLVTINAKNDEGNREIVEIQSIVKNAARNAEQSAERRHEETVAAIMTLRDGEYRTISRRSTQNFGVQAQFKASNFGETSITYTKGAVNEDESARAPGFQKDNFTGVTEEVLNALYFRTIAEREGVIADAHEQTFQWIFQDPDEHQLPWSNFSQWLERGTGCYWVNGKAGSGKSTLMKYLCRERRTTRALHVWAGGNELLIASFFFWNAGTALQKSQSGLLRSLLLKVLEEKRDLVPVLFPGLCRTLTRVGTRDLEPSFSELKQAFATLIRETLEDTRICLFIDGVDEYSGDHREISELFIAAANSEAVKIVVSSRPIPACVQIFSTCPTLRLQDLTSGDIAHYIEDTLVKHTLMQDMEAREPGTTGLLVNGITSKASGVFLWVMLVVKSLLNGLQNYDRMRDMMSRLDKLPEDLEALYKHMLGSMSLEYQRQASMMIQLIMRSTEVQDEGQMTLLQMSFAEDETPLQALSAPIEPISPENESMRSKATDGRIRSRCCGLVESQQLFRGSRTARGNAETYVGFLHRTVMDFLRNPVVWQDLSGLTKDSQIDLDELLLTSCLDEMKRKPPQAGQSKQSRDSLDFQYCLRYNAILEERTGNPQVAFLDEAYKVMEFYAQHFRSDPISRHIPWALEIAISQGFRQNNIELPDAGQLLFALNGSTLYLMHKLRKERAKPEHLNLLLMHIMLTLTSASTESENTIDVSVQNLFATVNVLLKAGASPNGEVVLGSPAAGITVDLWPDDCFRVLGGNRAEVTPWTCVLQFALYLDRRTGKHPETRVVLNCCQLIEQFLLSGADMTAKVRDDVDGASYSTESILHMFTSTVGSARTKENEIRQRILSLVRKAEVAARSSSKDQSTSRKGFFGYKQSKEPTKSSRRLSDLIAKLKS